MTESNQQQTIVPAGNARLDVMNRIAEFNQVAKVFADSGLFSDVKGQAQAFVKIMAGAEMGIPPFTAMNSFHIIQGKVTMSANAIAARIKSSRRYDFRIVEKSATRCAITFLEHGKPVHSEVWDATRAAKAGTKNMDKYPEAMLFARCITAGARAVAPDVVGQFYAPEELGAELDESGDVVPGEYKTASPSSVNTTDTTDPGGTPAAASRTAELFKLIESGAKKWADKGREPSEAQSKLAFLLLKEACGNDETKLHTVQHALTGFSSWKDVPGPYVIALVDWLKPTQDDAHNWHPAKEAVQDVETVVSDALVAAGQQSLA